jgi:hypothetical protein
MTLEQLMALGMSEEVAKKVLESHQKAIKDNYIPLSRFNEVNEAKKQLETDIKGRDKQLKDLGEKAKGNEDLEKQIKDLQETNKKTKADYDSKVKNITLDNAIKLSLKDNKAKHEDLLIGKFDREKLTIKEDGTVEGLDEQINTLKEGYKDLFEQPLKGHEPNNIGEPPNPDNQVNDLRSALAQKYTN